MNDPNTLVDGITGLDDLCSSSKVYIEQNQFASFVNILENYNQNPEILEHTVILINKILQFEVDCSSELFCTDIFLDFFFSNLDSPYVIDSLYHISKTSKHCAISVLEYANSYPNIIDLLLSNESENFELNLTFFSSFLLYKKDVFVEFVSKVIHKIFDLLESELRHSVRFACLSFINDALNNKTTIFDIILDHEKLSQIFNKEPNNRRERIKELEILISLQINFKIHHNNDNNIETAPKKKITTMFDKIDKGYVNFMDDVDTMSLFEPIEKDKDDEDDEDDDFDDNTATIILNKDLFSFVVSCLNVDMDHLSSELNPLENDYIDFDVACYALDVIKEMATNGFDVVQFLYQEEIVQIIWNFLNNEDAGHYYKSVCCLMTILEIFKGSTDEQKNLLIKNGLFDICSQSFDILTDRFLIEMLNDLKIIMDVARNEENEFVLRSIFETQSLMEQIDELSVDCSEPAAPVAYDVLMFAKSLITGNEEDEDDS